MNFFFLLFFFKSLLNIFVSQVSSVWTKNITNLIKLLFKVISLMLLRSLIILKFGAKFK